jgi:Zn-dependent protease
MSSTISTYIWPIISVILIIISIMLHEIGHGYAAFLMGDTTAKSQGRLTLNPLKHLDPFGSVLLPLILSITGGPIIGYAKPVPYNPYHFKNKRKGELIVGLAGPATNLVLALIGTLLAFLISNFLYPVSITVGYWAWQIAAQFVVVNLCLMFFNLIPLPPLDGSSIIAPFLNDKALAKYYQIQRYALPILLIVMILVPMIFNFNPIGIYINATAGNLSNLLLSL